VEVSRIVTPWEEERVEGVTLRERRSERRSWPMRTVERRRGRRVERQVERVGRWGGVRWEGVMPE